MDTISMLAGLARRALTPEPPKPSGIFGGSMGNVPPEKVRELKARVQENSQILDHMVLAPEDQKAQLKASITSTVPASMLRAVAREGVQIVVVRKDTFADPQTVGAYSAKHKLIGVRPTELLTGTPIHELAHAYDDALAPDVEVNGKKEQRNRSDQPDFQKIYRSYLKNTEGQLPVGQDWIPTSEMEQAKGSMWSGYARKNAHEYFAEGVEHFLHPFKKAELARTDPQLSQFLAQTLH
ncbi:hypothetical protein IV102_18585 [bacterium]|nr:hypothetical protein [bacterium]